MRECVPPRALGRKEKRAHIEFWRAIRRALYAAEPRKPALRLVRKDDGG